MADAVKVGDKAYDVAEVVDGVNDANITISKSIKYPGNDPTKSPGEGFEWRGKSTPDESKGNWYNTNTKERWNADLDHGDPIGPHWDYTDANGNKYRIFPDGRTEKK